MGGDSFRVRGVDVLPRFTARFAKRLGEVRKLSGPEVLLLGTQALEGRLWCSSFSAPTPFSFRNPGFPSSCSTLPPSSTRTVFFASLLPSHHNRSAFPFAPHQKTLEF